MKEKVLEKINDVSLLFTRLDENSDGQITLNELWKHSMIYKSPDSVCLLTDLMQHEDIDDDDKLDYTEFQAAFNKLFSVSMVTLDESLAINKIEAHLGDNVEIRCDITGEPQKPAIKWYRHGVDLSTLNLPYIKVFNDGSLYLTDLKLSFSGNYSCQAVNNPTVKQTHIVDVIVDPIVEVSPKFQWTPIGGVASFECRFETFEDDYIVHWFKNDEQLIDGPKVTIINNGTLLQVAALEQIDTGAYTCRITHKNGAFGQSVASLLVQDESVESSADISESHPQRLWIFHANGLTIYEGICGQTIHEIDARDIIYQNSLTLCGNGYSTSSSNNNNNDDNNEQTIIQCDWSEDIVQLNGLIYIAQPNLNRILVLNELQLSVVKVIATDPQPRRLRIVESSSSSSSDSQIWVLCDGNNIDNDDYNNYYDEQRSSSSKIPKDLIEAEWKNVGDYPTTSSSSSAGNKFDYLNEKYRKNRKTIQVIRLMHDGSSSLSSSSAKQSSSSSFEYNNNNNRQPQPQSQSSSSSIIHDHIDVIHLQPVDGHFDLVYDFFIPEHYESIFKNDYNKNMKKFMQNSPFAYATHWEERSLIKISINQLEYLHSIRLNDCQPIAVSIITRKAGGLLAVQCQTPITHQLNGQLILDQVTDAILIHNSHLNAHKSYLSPDHRYLVSIYHDFVNSSSSSSQCQHGRRCHMMASKYSQKTNTETIITNTSTIIVQKINNNGIEFMYDVRTSLDIVNCLFVWKNGNYDLILASGTPNREDLLYLSLIDGHVELISGIGRPTEGYYRGMALSEKNRILSITATESVFTVDLVTNRILCESNKHFQKPKTLIWTN
ncbi:follistatin-related protein 5-like [Dermatophagoides pteronyssinus]|uniref:follistatin-related protein 5-like n=1 Tax=Dermatophagoides pteronyssinus TaxID=6956 RepID=UPI003F67D3AB